MEIGSSDLSQRLFQGKKRYTPDERLFFTELVARNADILESSDLDAASLGKKKKTWQHIQRQFNSVAGHTPRTVKQLKKAWDNHKTKQKSLQKYKMKVQNSQVEILEPKEEESYKGMASVHEQGFDRGSGEDECLDNTVGTCVVTDGFPFAPRKSYDPEYVRQFIHLRPRTRAFSSLMRVRHCAVQALNQYFSDSGYVKVDVPVLTSNDCEGAGEVFLVKPDNQQLIKEVASVRTTPDEAFFNGKTYLTVSGQMHLEVAARALGKVYCCGPTFRAENSKSRLHLSEFYMAEAELAFTKSLDDILNLAEGLIKHISQRLMDTCAEDLVTFAKHQDVENSSNIEHLLQSPFTVDSYDSVCDILEKHREQFSQPLRRGEALSKEHELFLVKYNNNVPIFVIDWPAEIKPFYMKAHSDNPLKVYAVDLLCANVGELCGGSLREDDFGTLEEKLQNNNQAEKLNWYLELRKFGNVPTGGFGMGFERFLQIVLGIPNIKDAIPFPRWPHNCKL